MCPKLLLLCCDLRPIHNAKNAATSDLLRDQSPRQLSIHNVHVLATSRPPRPWYLNDVVGRKSPSTKRKWVPARQLWVLEPENFPPSLGASQGKRLWCYLCFQDYRFAFSAKDWSYCQNLKQIYLRKPPWQASALWNPQIITIFYLNAKWQCREEGSTWYGEHVLCSSCENHALQFYGNWTCDPVAGRRSWAVLNFCVLVATTTGDTLRQHRDRSRGGRRSLRFWYCESAFMHEVTRSSSEQWW